jgi:hypothetical protein
LADDSLLANVSRQPREFDFYIFMMVEQSIEDIPRFSFLGNGFHPQVSQTFTFLQLHRFTSLISNFRYFFAKKFQHIFQAASAKKAAGLSVQPAENHHTKSWLKRFVAFITGHPMVVVDVGAAAVDKKESRTIRKLTPEMIRRMDDLPKPINPSGSSSGWVRERPPSIPPGSERSFISTPEYFEGFPSNGQACRPTSSDNNRRRLSDPGPISRMLYSVKEVVPS